MNKRSLLLPLLTLIAFFCACNPDAKWETEDVHISIDLQYVSAGFVECSFSTDKDAYYLIAIDSVRQGYNPMERQKQFMMLALDSAHLSYLRWRNELLQDGEFHIAPFSSHSLQYGAVNYFFTSLTPNTDYWVYAFVVDPVTMKPIGKLHMVNTKTYAQSQVDISFHYRIKGSWDYIYPLDGHRNTGTIECNFLGGKRQCAVIFEHHDALTGSTVSNLQIVFLPLGHFIGPACFGQ